MQETLRYRVIHEENLDFGSLFDGSRRKSLCLLVDSAGNISRHTRDRNSVDSAVSNLNIVRGNGDVEAYLRRQLLGCGQLYESVGIVVHKRHEEAFIDAVAKVGFKPEKNYN